MSVNYNYKYTWDQHLPTGDNREIYNNNWESIGLLTYKWIILKWILDKWNGMDCIDVFQDMDK
jgi:hypothetical protein